MSIFRIEGSNVLCDCKFSTDSLRSLRSHYAANHGSGISFFKKFDDVIISNWEDFPLRTIRLFLLWKSNYECTSCGYDKARECGTSILEVDHIDGNHDNNTFRNLRVLCPNCHALTPKYRNWSNKGNKKRTSSLRPGNTDYDERHKKYEEKRIERQLEIEKKKALRDELRPDKIKLFESLKKSKLTFGKSLFRMCMSFIDPKRLTFPSTDGFRY